MIYGHRTCMYACTRTHTHTQGCNEGWQRVNGEASKKTEFEITCSIYDRTCMQNRVNLGYCQSPVRHFRWVRFLCHCGQDSQVVSQGDYR